MHNWLRRFDLRSWFLAMLVVATLGVAFLLYPHARQTEAPADGRKVKEIVYWAPTALSDAEKAAVEEFERQNPEYRVVVGSSTVRDQTGDPTRFLLGVAGDMPPDLIFFDRFAVVEWANRGAFHDLSGMIARDANTPSGVRPENFFEPVWKEATYKGGVYAVGNTVDTRAMYYLREPLIRAGFVYQKDDPEVLSGGAKVGEARPPKTWEELCTKRLQATGRASSDGTVEVETLVRRMAVNESAPAGARPDLLACGAQEGDVAVLISGDRVFRGCIGKVDGPRRFTIDLSHDQKPGLRSLPSDVTGPCEVKIFDQNSYVVRLTRFNPETGQISTVGFIPMFGNSWLYMYGWLNGGRFMDQDGEVCRLDSHEIVEALQFLTDLYDSLGGYQRAQIFQTAGVTAEATTDPFLRGAVTLRIDSNDYLQTILDYKPNADFGVAPSPIPQKRKAEGFQSVGWMGGFAYAIPSTAKDKEGAWKLMRWLLSVPGRQIMVDYDASVRRAQGKPYFPHLEPDKRVLAWVKKVYVDENPSVPRNFVAAYDTFSNLLPTSKYRPVTPVGQRLWNEHVRACETAVTHAKTPYDSLNYGARQVQTALNETLHPPTGPRVNWDWVIACYVAALVLFAVAFVALQEMRRRRYGGSRHQWLEGLACVSPWLIGFIVFGAGPIVFSFIISFCHYDVLSPARFIGVSNYVNLVGRHFDPVTKQEVWNDPIFWKSLANTVYMIIGVPLSIIGGLLLALLLDAKVRGQHFFRTLYYMPAIVPAVASFILWLWMFDPSSGMINMFLRNIGVSHPPGWLRDPLWAKPSLILMGLWGMGASMIIWLAGLKDIPESVREAAAIDGAGRFRRFVHITIPLLSPYILFNLIMGMIGVFQVFESAYIMTDGGPADSTRFYAYKLFDEAFRYLNMGVASAMAWLLFVIVLAITLLQLWLSRKWVHYGEGS